MSKLFSRLRNAFVSRKGYTDHVSPYDETEYERFIPFGNNRETLVKNIPNILYPAEYALNYTKIMCFDTAVLVQFCRTLTPEFRFQRNEIVYDVFRIPQTVRRDGYNYANTDILYIKNAFVREWSGTVRHFKTIGNTAFTCFIAEKEDTIRNIDYFRVLSDEPLSSRDIYLFVPRVQGLTVEWSLFDYTSEVAHCPTHKECPICLECFPTNRMVNMRCFHHICPECISGHINYRKKSNQPTCCPICRKQIRNITAANQPTINKVYFMTN